MRTSFGSLDSRGETRDRGETSAVLCLARKREASGIVCLCVCGVCEEVTERETHRDYERERERERARARTSEREGDRARDLLTRDGGADR